MLPAALALYALERGERHVRETLPETLRETAQLFPSSAEAGSADVAALAARVAALQAQVDALRRESPEGPRP